VRIFIGRGTRSHPMQISRTVRGGTREAQHLAVELEGGRACAGGRTVGEVLDEWVDLQLGHVAAVVRVRSTESPPSDHVRRRAGAHAGGTPVGGRSHRRARVRLPNALTQPRIVRVSSGSAVKQLGRPRSADADRTRTAILDAALAAFAERGFDGASIREITGAAGVGHNLVRHYFGSKEDLWRATVHHALDPSAAELTDVLRDGSDGSAEQTLRAGLDVLRSAVDENPAAIRLLVSEALRGGPRFDEIYDEVMAPIGAAFLAYLENSKDVVADADPRVISLFVFAAVYGASSMDGVVARLGLARDGRLDDGAAAGLVELVVTGLLGRS
jgi:TetR/AcrR family transcriptional regulator